MPQIPQTHAEVAAAIRRYVAANPSACDTAVGVATWWLPQQRPLADVQAGLALLVEQRVLMRRLLPDGDWIYSANLPLPGGGIAGA